DAASRADDRGLGRGGGDGEERGGLGPLRHLGARTEPDDGEGLRVAVQLHGASPTVLSPVLSSRPSARFMHWTAAPAVPLARLSTAPTATSRRASWSTVTWRCTALLPATDLVCGHCPSGSRCTNGSSPYAFS